MHVVACISFHRGMKGCTIDVSFCHVENICTTDDSFRSGENGLAKTLGGLLSKIPYLA
jgi:hypothetical protein